MLFTASADGTVKLWQFNTNFNYHLQHTGSNSNNSGNNSNKKAKRKHTNKNQFNDNGSNNSDSSNNSNNSNTILKLVQVLSNGHGSAPSGSVNTCTLVPILEHTMPHDNDYQMALVTSGYCNSNSNSDNSNLIRTWHVNINSDGVEDYFNTSTVPSNSYESDGNENEGNENSIEELVAEPVPSLLNCYYTSSIDLDGVDLNSENNSNNTVGVAPPIHRLLVWRQPIPSSNAQQKQKQKQEKHQQFEYFVIESSYGSGIARHNKNHNNPFSIRIRSWNVPYYYDTSNDEEQDSVPDRFVDVNGNYVGSVVKQLSGHTDTINDMLLLSNHDQYDDAYTTTTMHPNSNNSYLVSCSDDMTIKLWSLNTSHRLIHTISESPSPSSTTTTIATTSVVPQCMCRINDRVVVTGSGRGNYHGYSGSLKFWDFTSVINEYEQYQQEQQQTVTKTKDVANKTHDPSFIALVPNSSATSSIMSMCYVPSRQLLVTSTNDIINTDLTVWTVKFYSPTGKLHKRVVNCKRHAISIKNPYTVSPGITVSMYRTSISVYSSSASSQLEEDERQVIIVADMNDNLFMVDLGISKNSSKHEEPMTMVLCEQAHEKRIKQMVAKSVMVKPNGAIVDIE